jgi:hypothetical protein
MSFNFYYRYFTITANVTACYSVAKSLKNNLNVICLALANEGSLKAACNTLIYDITCIRQNFTISENQ